MIYLDSQFKGMESIMGQGVVARTSLGQVAGPGGGSLLYIFLTFPEIVV